MSVFFVMLFFLTPDGKPSIIMWQKRMYISQHDPKLEEIHFLTQIIYDFFFEFFL